MTDKQLYLYIGIPTIAVVLGLITNGFPFNALSARMSSLEARMLALETSVNQRFSALESSVNQRIDMLIGEFPNWIPALAFSKIAPIAHNLLYVALPLQ
jgi:hypothetical protein